MSEKTREKIVDTLAGLTIVGLLVSHFAITYPGPTKIVGGIFLATWVIGKLIEWWGNR
jgi:hypothetical protein